MNGIIQHKRLQRAFSIFATATILFATAALLLAVDISTASAVPQDLTAEEAKEDCENAGGNFEDYFDEGYACVYDGFTQVCRQGTCKIICHDGITFECISDHKLELPDTTPPPTTPPRGGPVIVDPPIQVAEAPDTSPPKKTQPRGGDCLTNGEPDPGIC